MYRKNTIDFHCTIEIAVANRVGTVTITALNMIDKQILQIDRTKMMLRFEKGVSF